MLYRKLRWGGGYRTHHGSGHLVLKMQCYVYRVKWFIIESGQSSFLKVLVLGRLINICWGVFWINACLICINTPLQSTLRWSSRDLTDVFLESKLRITLRLLYMSAQIIQTMAFTHIMVILTSGRSVEDHIKFTSQSQQRCQQIKMQF